MQRKTETAECVTDTGHREVRDRSWSQGETW